MAVVLCLNSFSEHISSIVILKISQSNLWGVWLIINFLMREDFISVYLSYSFFIDSKNYSGLVKEFIKPAYATACLKLHPEFAR